MKIENNRLVGSLTSDEEIFIGLDRLVEQCHYRSKAAGWWNLRDMPVSDLSKEMQGYVCGTKLALIHSEISEALEGLRKNKMDDHLPHRKAIEVEIADAFVRLADLAGFLELDVASALLEKLEYNAKRSDHKPEVRNVAGGKGF